MWVLNTPKKREEVDLCVAALAGPSWSPCFGFPDDDDNNNVEDDDNVEDDEDHDDDVWQQRQTHLHRKQSLPNIDCTGAAVLDGDEEKWFALQDLSFATCFYTSNISCSCGTADIVLQAMLTKPGVYVEERCQTFQYTCHSEFWRASNGSVTWSAKSKTKTPFSMAVGFIHRANWPLVSGFNPEVKAQTSMIIFWPVEFACFWLLDSTDCRRWSWGSVSWSWSWRREAPPPQLRQNQFLFPPNFHTSPLHAR